jgi:hypothetical protein
VVKKATQRTWRAIFLFQRFWFYTPCWGLLSEYVSTRPDPSETGSILSYKDMWSLIQSICRGNNCTLNPTSMHVDFESAILYSMLRPTFWICLHQACPSETGSILS